MLPRCLRYHTPVWDALIWRFVRRVEPTGCSQSAHLLRNYPPYSTLLTHSEPLEPFQASLSAAAGAMSDLSLHQPAVAAPAASPSINPVTASACTGDCDAPTEVDASGSGADSDSSGDWESSSYDEYDGCVGSGFSDGELDCGEAQAPGSAGGGELGGAAL